MDRSKPDRPREGVRRGGSSDEAHVDTVVVKLGRGGPQEWTYYRLTPSQQKEWEAVEDLIERLAKGKVLYSYGPVHAERIRSKYWIGRAGPRQAVGVTAIPKRSQLHEMLVCNVRERFCLVIAHRDLSDAEVMEMWRDIDACLPHADVVERHAYIHCAAVEMANHDCLEVVFRKEDSKAITQVIQRVLGHPFKT